MGQLATSTAGGERLTVNSRRAMMLTILCQISAALFLSLTLSHSLPLS